MSMKDFKVTMALGKGSYGSVYKCKRRSDGFDYAVKEVNITKLSEREREDAVNEIRVLASVNHVNIIRYCDAFVERDNLYIVMEFAERGDIHHKIKKYKEANRCIREEVIWSYFIQMARGLGELHSRRIMHRDIKPKNVFITAKDHIRIGDLGCSKVMKHDLARTQIGTPYYMAPEIWSHSPYDEKADVWALGCVLFELCGLRPPFLAKDMPGLATKVKAAPTPTIPRHFSSDLQALVQAMLNKSPYARPTIAEILAMPCVMAHTHTVPRCDEEDPFASAGGARLLDTIKFPKRLPGRRLTLDLPEPSYPSRRRSLSPTTAKENRLSPRSVPGDGGMGSAMGGAGCASKPSQRIMTDLLCEARLDPRHRPSGGAPYEGGPHRPRTSPTPQDMAGREAPFAPSAPRDGRAKPGGRHPSPAPAPVKPAQPPAAAHAKPTPPAPKAPGGGIASGAGPRRVTDLHMPAAPAHHGPKPW